MGGNCAKEVTWLTSTLFVYVVNTEQRICPITSRLGNDIGTHETRSSQSQVTPSRPPSTREKAKHGDEGQRINIEYKHGHGSTLSVCTMMAHICSITAAYDIYICVYE